MKKTLNVSLALEKVIEDAALAVETAALVAISEKLHALFDDLTFEREIAKASGKKRLSDRAMDDIADEIKKRALKDIARIFEQGLY